jgi:acyl-CoA dehydrogenase
MAIDFTPEPATLELRDRVRAFVRDVVVPAELELAASGNGPTDALRRRLQKAAAEGGLLAPTAPERWGGLGLSVAAQSEVLQAAGYSLLGPPALNCAAPDEGNMHLMHKAATPEQQEKYLAPLPFSWPRNGAPGPRARYGCLPRYLAGQTVGEGFERAGPAVPALVESGLTTLR